VVALCKLAVHLNSNLVLTYIADSCSNIGLLGIQEPSDHMVK
jgi:hypothetical protein